MFLGSPGVLGVGDVWPCYFWHFEEEEEEEEKCRDRNAVISSRKVVVTRLTLCVLCGMGCLIKIKIYGQDYHVDINAESN